jgi:hypothetical protein
VIVHPHGNADAAVVGLLFGGAATYLLVQVWYLKFVTGRLSRPRAVGVAALVCALVGLAAARAAPMIALATAAAIMAALAIAIARATPASTF